MYSLDPNGLQTQRGKILSVSEEPNNHTDASGQGEPSAVPQSTARHFGPDRLQRPKHPNTVFTINSWMHQRDPGKRTGQNLTPTQPLLCVYLCMYLDTQKKKTIPPSRLRPDGRKDVCTYTHTQMRFHFLSLSLSLSLLYKTKYILYL